MVRSLSRSLIGATMIVESKFFLERCALGAVLLTFSAIVYVAACSGTDAPDKMPPAAEYSQDADSQKNVASMTDVLKSRMVGWEIPYHGPFILPDGRIAMPRAVGAQGTDDASRKPSSIPYIWGLDGRTAGPTGPVNIIVAKVKFTDFSMPEIPRENLEEWFFNTDPAVYPDSLAEYYDRESFGLLDVAGVVLPAFGSYNVPGSFMDFVMPPWMGDPGTYISLWENLLAQIDEDVDGAEFDGNNDGAIDAIIVVPPDGDPGIGGPFAFVNNHAVDGLVECSMDGKDVETYSIQINCFNDSNMRYSVPWHEFGHILGLPDLYDDDGYMNSSPGPDGDEGMGPGGWSVMCFSGHIDCNLPMSAPMKMLLGWDTPVDLSTEAGTDEIVTLEWANEAGGRLRRIFLGNGIGFVGGNEVPYEEYFVFEARNLTPQGMPDEGMLLWHVNENIYLSKVFGAVFKMPNADEEYKFVDLVETPHQADEIVDKPVKEDFSATVRESDIWPYENYDSINSDIPVDVLYEYKYPVLRRSIKPAPYFAAEGPLLSVDEIARLSDGISFHYFADEQPPPPPQIESFQPMIRYSGFGSSRTATLSASVSGNSSIDSIKVRLSYFDAGHIERLMVLDAVDGNIGEIDITPIMPNQRIVLIAVGSDGALESDPVSASLDAVTLLADINGDDVVNENDAEALHNHFAVDSGDPGFREWLDPDGNGIVDERDSALIGYLFGMTRITD